MSGFGNYAGASSGFAIELAASLTSADVQALASDVGSIGRRSWLQWQIAHEDEVCDYIAATPAGREKKKAWRDPAVRRRLVLAAIAHALAAEALLGFLHRYQYELSPGGSYRDTTALAGRLYWELMGTELPDWPEPFERVCPSPFGE